MNGPFTTIAVQDFQKMQNAIHAARIVNESFDHAERCSAKTGKPCTCGLSELNRTLVALDPNPWTHDDA